MSKCSQFLAGLLHTCKSNIARITEKVLDSNYEQIHHFISESWVRSWRAWYHHIALTLMALHFILELQAEVKEEVPLLSISAIKFIFAQKLASKMSTEQGLEKAIKLRHKQRKADIERYRKTPK